MALDKDKLTAVEALSTLNEDQINAIAELSANDENAIISQKIGEHNGRIESDIKEVTGVDKQEGEKYYEYMKRTLSQYKTAADGAAEFQQKQQEYESTINSLKSQIEKGSGDATLKQELQDARNQLKDLQDNYQQKEKGWQDKLTGYEKRMQQTRIDTEFGKARAGLKLKGSIPEAAAESLIEAERREILATLTPDWVDAKDGSGNKELVFRDAEGRIKNNPANNLNPYTMAELVRDGLRAKGVLDEGREQKGAGTGAQGSDTDDPATLESLNSARSRVQADEIIEKHLLALGMVKTSQAFHDKFAAIRSENIAVIDKLPLTAR